MTGCHELLLVASQDGTQIEGSARFHRQTGAIVHRLLQDPVGGAEFLENFRGQAGLTVLESLPQFSCLTKGKKMLFA